MSSAGAIAYNPSDTLQEGFLSALAQGETGSAGLSALNEGFGGVDLSAQPTTSTGFPIWSGANVSTGPTSAAGIFQFQSGTWQNLATQFGLNFQNPTDQEAGAWYLAQATYAQKTGGQSLEQALASGDFSSIQSALAGIWPSVMGNAAAPSGLASTLSVGGGPQLSPGSDIAQAPITGTSTNGGSGGGGIISDIENWFERGGLILIGGLIAIVALFFVIKEGGPGKAIKAIA